MRVKCLSGVKGFEKDLHTMPVNVCQSYIDELRVLTHPRITKSTLSTPMASLDLQHLC